MATIMNLTTKLQADGFVTLRGRLPEHSGIFGFHGLGSVVQLPGVSEVQVLTPRETAHASPNTYSGNFSVQTFPLHTDLAHWFLPPRYLALRCIVGSRYVSTKLVDVKDLITVVGRHHLMRALVRPRRPLGRNRPLLRVLSRNEDGAEIFRWDSLFVVPATNESQVVCQAMIDGLAYLGPHTICLEHPGDTLIIDNWRVLHGRSEVPTEGESRRIERAYFGDLL